MKNMNDKTKKWLTVAGCLVICAVLVGLIGTRFRTEPPQDAPLPTQSSQPSDVTVDPGSTTPAEKEKEPVVIPPDLSTPAPSNNGAVSSGTEQTIQPDASKPEYTEDQLTDPTQKPNGDAVTEQDKPVEHDKVVQPTTPSKPQESQPQGGDTSGGKIYVPGFGWIDDIGEGQGTTVDGDGDINKQVGQMG